MPKRSEHWLAETRERIESAATELVASRGFLGFSMRDLLLEAWVSTGCFYHHFRDKEEVLCAVAANAGGVHHRRRDGWLADEGATSRLRKVLHGAVLEYAPLLAEADGRLHVLCWAELLSGRGLAASYARDLDELIASFHQVIREGQERGEIDRHISVPAAAMAVTGLYLMVPLMRAMGFRFTPRQMTTVLDRMVGALAP